MARTRAQALAVMCLAAIGLSAAVRAAPAAAEGEPPAIANTFAAGVEQTSATLTGEVSPSSQPVTACEFQYVELDVFTAEGFAGSPVTLACSPAAAELGEEAGFVPVSALAEGLSPDVGYVFRIVAANASGVTEGAPAEFRTPASPPTAVTTVASSLSNTDALLAGEVNPNGLGPNADTEVFFEYGPNPSYGTATAAEDVGLGTESLPITAVATHLEPGVTYHYRIVASNGPPGSRQTVFGSDQTFTVSPLAPILETPVITELTSVSATVAAVVDPRGLATRVALEVGPAGQLTERAATTLREDGPQTVSLASGPLTSGGVEYYRINAESEAGKSSSEGTFTLPQPAPAGGPLGQPPSPPLLATPPITFPTTPSSSQQHQTASIRRHLRAALRACRRNRAKKRRLRCERQAHKRYPISRRSK
jgi:hypothetical protein